MSALTVVHIMTRKVIYVRPETPLIEVHDLISKYGLVGVPVIDGENRVVGIITEHDLISRSNLFHPDIIPEASESALTQQPVKQNTEGDKKLVASDVMNPEPLVLPDTATLNEVMAVFREHHKVNPIPVVDQRKKLAGIVSRYDVLKLLGVHRDLGRQRMVATALTALRIGLGLTFVWLGVLILLDPDKWGLLIQPWVAQHLLPFSVRHTMIDTAVLDVTIGLFLLTGYFVTIVATVGVLHLIVIIATTGFGIQSAVAARDIGLIAGLVALVIISPQTRIWLDKIQKKIGFKNPKLSSGIRMGPVEERIAQGVASNSSELIQYVRESRRRGSTNEEIKQELTKAGWPPEDIEQVLRR